MPAFDRRVGDFEAANTQVLGISTDSPFSHENWAKSVGISLYPLDGDDVETLMKKADDAMYRVKKSAKGGFRFFNDVAGASSVSAS